jgi:hypothetical protein
MHRSEPEAAQLLAQVFSGAQRWVAWSQVVPGPQPLSAQG